MEGLAVRNRSLAVRNRYIVVICYVVDKPGTTVLGSDKKPVSNKFSYCATKPSNSFQYLHVQHAALR